MIGTGSGAGMLQVSPGALRAAAERAHEISQAVGALARDVSPACSAAASVHSGWQFGQELAALVSPWEHQFSEQGSSVASSGDKLNSSAADYTAAENANIGDIRAVYQSPAG